MKFSTLLILLPFATVALAAANPQTGTDYDTATDQCAQKYCNAFVSEILKCSTVHADTTSQAYLNCVCSENISFEQCIGCYPEKSMSSQYSDQRNKLCSTYSSNKKSAASSDKTCSWRIFGLAVAGGLIAAL
ncbi:hypothetical protein L211DRAFT_135147 [Terfezia boudieri ATCC MYA-4762]|uniref:Extracellular membrane protein CFEM domain-containing protein n=1 Tax=Terfezia boudieri ATCC MYA-4762 TaxID=1051890 RepID=A0A3N4LV19_9PEZI|nr:hypothetical protein L211DRAFT_135147 [Terfezia boudieri ATCC MYA-4762]